MMSSLIPAARGALRLMPVETDNMAPTLRRGDWVLVEPTSRFRFDGLYVIEVLGVPCVYRCQSDFSGGIDARSDNPAYRSVGADAPFLLFAGLSREAFEAKVLGYVVAHVNAIDRGAMERLA